MRTGRGYQVGLQTNVVEDAVGGEVRRDGRIGGGGGVDACQGGSHLGGKGGVGVTVA